MTKHKSVIFISDLHLDKNRPDLTDQFLSLLANLDKSITALYILGDLFEAWVGDDETHPFLTRIKYILKSTTQKIPIYIMQGNRDFLLGKQFMQETGCQLLPDEIVITPFKTPILLMHGDLLCTKDKGYLKMRTIFRNPFVQHIFLFLPLSWRKKIARHARAKSAKATKKADLAMMDVTEDAVKAIMHKYHVNYLIHGHTHRPGTYIVSSEKREKYRMVLGAWHDKANMWVWNEKDDKQFVVLPRGSVNPLSDKLGRS